MSKHPILGTISVFVAVILLLFAGFSLGVSVTARAPSNLPPSYLKNAATGTLSEADFGIFWQAWNVID